MNKFRLYFVLFSLSIALFSCVPEDTEVIPLRDYAVQYAADNAMIEDYLKTYYIKIVDHPGYPDDQDIIMTKNLEDDPEMTLIWDSPYLKSKEVEMHGITYKIYYIQSRIGDMENGDAPSTVDQVLASYEGNYLKYTSTTANGETVTTLDDVPFESVEYPQQWLGLDFTIKGWTEIFPLFYTGTYNGSSNTNDPAQYNDFGAGVMFLPSGLGYYAAGSFEIPGYSPLVFSFKLYDVKHVDHDGDGILSNDEDINHDGLFTDDTDGDGTYDIYDIDDDGDGKLTKNEIKNAEGEVYDFNSIPDCSGNTTDPNRIKRYLDKTCFKD